MSWQLSGLASRALPPCFSEFLAVSTCTDLVIVRPNKTISAEFPVLFLDPTFVEELVAEKAVRQPKRFSFGAAK
ncbi:hypothetical protein NY751_07500 [Xanthomonas campestris]|uniref:hypothetical protein n=1 Tax=Xanthomonas campestris TaxID=339 RepID=UPI00235A44D1|nr:hypothetical protein [Xanthomonas campestris]MDC8745937.1 hypothetical protein [Xanthomonas campestris]